MKVYVLLTAYPHEGGFIHGVFSSYEKAKEALNSYDFGYDYPNTYIEKISKNNFHYRQIEV